MRYPSLQQSLRVIRKISPGSISHIVDIGAQRKTDFLMSVFPDLFHHLFEPVKIFHSDLEKNYTERNIAYKLYDMALSNANGRLFLHNTSVDGSGNITHAQIRESREENMPFLKNIDEVETKRLDDVLTTNMLGGDLSYLIKLDVDGVEEKIIDGGGEIIRGASFVVIEASIGRQDLCSRAAVLEKHGFRIFDICDNAYYFEQLALVDLIMINNRLREKEIKFRPWQYSDGKVIWSKWQHGFPEFADAPIGNPFD